MFAALTLAVAIVAHDPGYHTSLANHLKRWLGEEGVAARVVTPREMPSALAAERLAFLVGFGAPSAGEMTALKTFRQRGGKLVVFHSAAPALAALVGVKPLGYASAAVPGQWSRMDFDTRVLAGAPAYARQTSTVLHRVSPLPGRGRVLARWSNRLGRPTGDAAWIQTDAGWWMSHVLLADGDEPEKARLCAAMCAAVDPRLWSVKASDARRRERESSWRAYAARQMVRPGEIHAVWDHSGCGLYPGDWARTFAVLKQSHVTDLFVNVAGAGFAHYPSAVLPRSKTFVQEGDQMAACLAAAKGTGIRVHAWILCFTATRATPEQLEVFRKRGWRLKATDGKLTEYLDPSNPNVRAHVLAGVDELQARYPSLAGIHLDFVRWYERAQKPKGADAFVTRFVGEARRHVKRPRWLTAAVLGKYPACVGSVGQNWTGWLDARLVDYVVPMDYAASMERFESYLRQHAEVKARAPRVIVGLGVTANESRLDARAVMDQILMTRRYGLAGNALFDLDAVLERNVLPYLRLGLW